MKLNTHLRIQARPCQGTADALRIRDFLIATYRPAQWDHNWEIRRWEGWWWYRHAGELDGTHPWMASVRLWETESGDVIGVAHPEGSGSAYLEIHPDFRHIEDEMCAWAEDQLAVPTDDGRRRLGTAVKEYDTLRQEVLARRGYQKTPGHGYSRRRALDAPIPAGPVAEGYTLRALRPDDAGDTARWMDVIRAVFPHASSLTPAMYHTFQTRSPSYRHDLHLVTEASDGIFAAFCGITWVPALKLGIFEPIGTHPDHRRKGLQRALMAEGLRRLKALGAVDAGVGTGEMIPANRLYEAMGFTDSHLEYWWEKIF